MGDFEWTNEIEPSSSDVGVGDRVEMVHMPDDPHPIEPGEVGTVTSIQPNVGVIGVQWDNGRTLNLVIGVDQYTLISEGSDVSDINKSMPKPTLTGKKATSGHKKMVKNFKAQLNKGKVKDIKVEAEEDLEETTMAGGGISTGHVEGQLESIIFKVGDLMEATNTGSISATVNFLSKNYLGWNKENTSAPWPGKNPSPENGKKEDWWWQKKPIYNNGKIVDKYASADEVWDDDNLEVKIDQDINQDKTKTHKKSVITTNKAFELNIDPINNDKDEALLSLTKEELIKTINLLEGNEEDLDEATVAMGGQSTGHIETPLFAAKSDDDWEPSKKTQYPGGKIVQKIKSDGVLTENKVINLKEINKVKYNKDGEYVKFKKKCVKYDNGPHCSQGTIDDPLSLSKDISTDVTEVNMTESGRKKK